MATCTTGPLNELPLTLLTLTLHAEQDQATLTPCATTTQLPLQTKKRRVRERLSSDKREKWLLQEERRRSRCESKSAMKAFLRGQGVFTMGAVRHGAAAYVKRCILHQQENFKLQLLAVLQVTHLIGTGSPANYILNTFLGLVALMETYQKWREFWKGSSKQSRGTLSTQEAHGPHLGFLDQNEILIGISGNTSVHHNLPIFRQIELQ